MTNKTKGLRYSERFKRQVVMEVLSGQLTRNGAMRKYGIGGSTTVHRWCIQYGGTAYLEGQYIDLPPEVQAKERMMLEQEQAIPLPDDPQALKARIAQLETQLAAEKLKRQAVELAVQIAKRDLGIDVLKKCDTKQSRK